MSEDFNKEKVLQRVKKMMALANDAAATEGERDNAIRMAHATLAKYNLSMAEADAAGTKSEEKRKGEGVVGKDYPWMRTTAGALATLFFCEYFYIRLGGGSVKHFYVGKESNVFTAQEMTQFVIRSIDREARKVAMERTGNAGGTFWRSFCKGAADTVWHRCAKIRKEAEAAPKTPGTALVLASVYALEQKANVQFMSDVLGIKDLKEGKHRERNTSFAAYGAGQEFGDRVNLNKQIGGTSPDQKKIR